ncbi:PNC1 [Symbiodinium pilosum]|uniref:PNC1 protein n=1 Tax=Symbiodinium pilosum TaxID=2952 RepID=A0A812NWG2_SYMPI|nr:PNC1 [Symbiodinium pilosum]
MQGAVMKTCAWSAALLVLRVADAVLVRRMGDEPDKLRDVEAITPFGEKADGVSRPHLELVNKTGVLVKALDECICGFGTFWDSEGQKCVPQLTKGVTCGGFAQEDWPLACQDGLTCKLPADYTGKEDAAALKQAICLDCTANDKCQPGRQMCQRVFAVSGQACATVKVTVPNAKATMSVTKNVTVKATSTKNAHAAAKETATVSTESVQKEATETAIAKIPDSKETKEVSATRSATASAVATREATADIVVPYTQSAIRTATMTRSADGYAQGMAYATACANPEGPLRTPDAQAAAASAAYALEKAFRQAANFALQSAKATAMADAKGAALTTASKEAFEAAKDAASEVAKAAAVSQATAGVKDHAEKVAEETAKARAVAAAKEAAQQAASKDAKEKASKLAEAAAQEKAEQLAKGGSATVEEVKPAKQEEKKSEEPAKDIKKDESEKKEEVKKEEVDKEDMFAKWTANDALEKEAAEDKKAAAKEAAVEAKEAAKEEEKKEAMASGPKFSALYVISRNILTCGWTLKESNFCIPHQAKDAFKKWAKAR